MTFDPLDSCHSLGAKKVVKFRKRENQKNKKETDVSAIGQFGVGFYSSYMVAEMVDVLSKSAENKDSNLWSSNGKNNYNEYRYKR